MQECITRFQSDYDCEKFFTSHHQRNGHDEGRKYRDTFASLKKTCHKVEIKFWDYLIDRTYHYNK